LLSSPHILRVSAAKRKTRFSIGSRVLGVATLVCYNLFMGRGTQAGSKKDAFAAVLGTGRGALASDRAKKVAAAREAREHISPTLDIFEQSEEDTERVRSALERAFDQLEAGTDPYPENETIDVLRGASGSSSIISYKTSLSDLVRDTEAQGFFGALWLTLGQKYDLGDEFTGALYEISTKHPEAVARQAAFELCEGAEDLLGIDSSEEGYTQAQERFLKERTA